MAPNPMDQIEDRVTVFELAEKGRVHVETVRRAIRAGELKAEGKRAMKITVTEAERWLRNRCSDREQVA